MDNLDFVSHSQTSLEFGHVHSIFYEHATKTLLILNQHDILFFLKHSLPDNTFSISSKTQPIEELQQSKLVFLSYLVENDVALCMTEAGDIFTVDEEGNVDLKAKNDDGITGGSLSPTQQHIYAVTNNNTLIQMDTEYDLVKQVPLDDSQTEKVDSFKPGFSWKVDGSFFSINIQTDQGRKCHSRDHMMGLFRSAAKSDPKEDDLVQSVSEKSRDSMSHLVAWQPAGIIAGSDYINKEGKKINRIIFWQKNGLRHLEFELQDNVTDVLNIDWSADSKILLVEGLLKNSERALMFYHRANYHWYLKQTMVLNQQVQYSLVKHRNNSIMLVDKDKIEVYGFEIVASASEWKTQEREKANKLCPHYVVDGSKVKVTDFSKGMIPPPMCNSEEDLKQNIIGITISNNNILSITQSFVYLYNYTGKEQKSIHKYGIGQLKGKVIVNLCLLQQSPLVFTTDDSTYKQKQGAIVLQGTSAQYSQDKSYTFNNGQENININTSLTNQVLYINDQKINEHCTSYIFYHQFVLFTCSSSGMYDKMFVFNLHLDKWIYDDDTKGIQTIQGLIEEVQNKKMLNYRSIERGAKIIGLYHNRVTLQLPRGNLQGIYPKLITINAVKKALNNEEYKLAFQIIRTHKLDLNLLYDLNPKRFTESAQNILVGIGKVDYINLFVSQLKDTVSSQLQYCMPPNEIEDIENCINIQIQNNKVLQVCKIVSSTLRNIDIHKYILSIFTSQIKMGLLNNVLKEIKELKEKDPDQEVLIPPHMQANKGKKPKILTSQEILQYVCWLVDANVIYQASLLTYDLDLASMTARCTQMDPKQYIPYIQSLKQLKNGIQLKKKICIDLKKYDVAIKQLSFGQKEDINLAMDLIKKHTLFKVGLKVFQSQYQHLKRVKEIIAQHLLQTNQINQAYSVYRSIGCHIQALKIAKQLLDSNKILETIDEMFENQDQKKQQVNEILKGLGDQLKNKNQVAQLCVYVRNYKEAISLYLKAGNYQKAYTLFHKLNYEQAIKQFTSSMSLICSLHKNLLLKDKNACLQKHARLGKVHKYKKLQGQSFSQKPRENDDMYSEVSVSSKSNSSYTISTTTGMRKKKDKKKSILARNVKEGSPLEEEYILAFINDIKSRLQANLKESKIMIQHLIYLNMMDEAENIRNVTREYIDAVSGYQPKSFAQVRFEELHLEASELYAGEQKQKVKIDSFNYLF